MVREEQRRRAEYRKKRENDKKQFKEVLKKGLLISHSDVTNFYNGLTLKERRLAGIMYIYKCSDQSMTPSDIHAFLKD